MLYRYTAFGIRIDSDIEIPALMIANSTEPAEICIRNSIVPDKLQDKPIEINKFGSYNIHESLVSISGLVKFYIHKGREILVEVLKNSPEEINGLLVANCLPILLFQRNSLLFHCSGVFTSDSNVVLFAAPKHTGKSTLAVLLQERGYNFFTDDTVLISFDNGNAYCRASYPSVRLNDESIAIQKNFLPNDSSSGPVGEDGKSMFYFHSQFSSTEAKISAVVFLQCTGDEMFTQKLTPAEAFKLATSNIYRRNWVWKLGKQHLEFEFANNLLKTVPAWRAVRPEKQASFISYTDMVDSEIISTLVQ